MSDFLTLCQYLNQEVETGGTGPSAVAGQTGDLGRYVKWVKDGWTELQQEREDWLWMRKSFTVNTVASDGAYVYGDCTDTVSAVAIARFSRWYRDSFKAYLQSDGVGSEYPLRWLEWERFRRIYRYGTQTNQQPIHVSVDPTQAFVLGPIPNAVYVVSGDYQLGPQTLSADADTPEMPARFHNLIVFEAMQKYGANKVAHEILLRAAAESSRLHFALEMDQLPKLTFGGPLA